MDERVTVALGRRGVQVAGVVFFGDGQGVLSADGADAERLDGEAQIFGRAGGRGHIEDVVDGAGIEGLADVSVLELEARLGGEVGDVLHVAGGQVVNAENGVAFAKQAVSEVRT